MKYSHGSLNREVRPRIADGNPVVRDRSYRKGNANFFPLILHNNGGMQFKPFAREHEVQLAEFRARLNAAALNQRQPTEKDQIMHRTCEQPESVAEKRVIEVLRKIVGGKNIAGIHNAGLLAELVENIAVILHAPEEQSGVALTMHDAVGKLQNRPASRLFA